MVIAKWNTLTGSARTVTVYGLVNGAAVPNNDQIWLECQYFGSSSSPLASFANNTKASNLATGSALTADSTSNWASGLTARDNAMAYELAYRGRTQILKEIKSAAAFLTLLKRDGMNVVVVESNHDLALERYIREGRYRNDGHNIRIGLQLEDAYLGHREQVADALDAYTKPPKFSMLEHAIKRFVPELEGVRWVYDGDSFVVDGVECGHHGFRGSNGAQGTVSGFARLGRKMSIGDKHSPEINEGVYVDGVTELDQRYNRGPSGWAVSLICQYLDGKRTIITLQNGKFCG
jgi:hypothetical protein